VSFRQQLLLRAILGSDGRGCFSVDVAHSKQCYYILICYLYRSRLCGLGQTAGATPRSCAHHSTAAHRLLMAVNTILSPFKQENINISTQAAPGVLQCLPKKQQLQQCRPAYRRSHGQAPCCAQLRADHHQLDRVCRSTFADEFLSAFLISKGASTGQLVLAYGIEGMATTAAVILVSSPHLSF
jgi:hypothetical protein